MVEIGRRRGTTSMTVPLMIGALVLMAGFFYWLAVTAEPTAPPEIADEEGTGQVTTVDALAVDAAEFGASPSGYVTLTVQLDDVTVTQMVGDNAFFIDLPQSPFLVHAGPAVAAAGLPAVNQTAVVIGKVTEMTPDVVAGWAQAGEFAEEDRALIEFATHYIEAVEVRSTGGEPGAAGGSDASGSGA